jgi:Leucine-rich repeat (LRR) protein
LAAGLVSVHGLGFVHRDVVFQNIALEETGSDLKAKLTGFGFTCSALDESAWMPEFVPMHAWPPEVCNPPVELYNYSSDVFGFGLLLADLFRRGRGHGVRTNHAWMARGLSNPPLNFDSLVMASCPTVTPSAVDDNIESVAISPVAQEMALCRWVSSSLRESDATVTNAAVDDETEQQLWAQRISIVPSIWPGLQCLSSMTQTIVSFLVAWCTRLDPIERPSMHVVWKLLRMAVSGTNNSVWDPWPPADLIGTIKRLVKQDTWTFGDGLYMASLLRHDSKYTDSANIFTGTFDLNCTGSGTAVSSRGIYFLGGILAGSCSCLQPTLLALQGNGLTDASLHAFKHLPVFLTGLDLSENNIGDIGAEILATDLRGNTTLVELQLRDNNIGDSGVLCLLTSLRAHHSRSALVELDIDGNCLRDVSLAGQLYVELTLCKLRNPKITRFKLKPTNGLRHRNAPRSHHYGSHNEAYSSYSFTKEDLSSIAAALRTNTWLLYLELDNCYLSDADATLIADAIPQESGLMLLFGDGAPISSTQPVSEELQRRWYMDAVFRRLAVPACKTVNFCAPNLKLEDEKLGRIAQNLHSHINELVIATASVSDAGISLLADSLRDNTSLTMLILTSNRISDLGALALAEVIQTNTGLLTFDLSFNDLIGDRGATALAVALQNNQSLTSFALTQSAGGISAVGARALANAVNDRAVALTLFDQTLPIADIKGHRVTNLICNLDLVSALVLASCLERNQSVETLTIDYNSDVYKPLAGEAARALGHVLCVHETLSHVIVLMSKIQRNNYFIAGQQEPRKKGMIPVADLKQNVGGNPEFGVVDDCMATMLSILLREKNVIFENSQCQIVVKDPQIKRTFLCACFCAALRHPACKSIDAANKDLGDVEASDMAKFISQSTSLEQLKLQGNNISSDHPELLKALLQSKSLTDYEGPGSRQGLLHRVLRNSCLIGLILIVLCKFYEYALFRL